MNLTYESDDWQDYRMDIHSPHSALEPLEREILIVDEALQILCKAGVLPHCSYDYGKMLAHRQAVQDSFEIPWTAITPRMQRLLYAINAIAQPQVMIAAGVFCGFTFVSNAGAAIGPGACYQAQKLIGIEIKPQEAARAQQNVRRLDPTGAARIVADDAVHFIAGFSEPIDLLYLDADGAGGKGKSIYLDILEAACDRMHSGSLVLAHNSVNCAAKLESYLRFVRNPNNLRASINVVFDTEGLEVSVK